MIYLWLFIILFIVPTIIKDRREYQEWSKK